MCQRIDYANNLRENLLEAIADSPVSSAPTSPKPTKVQVKEPPTKRTDTLRVPAIFRAPPSILKQEDVDPYDDPVNTEATPESASTSNFIPRQEDVDAHHTPVHASAQFASVQSESALTQNGKGNTTTKSIQTSPEAAPLKEDVEESPTSDRFGSSSTYDVGSDEPPQAAPGDDLVPEESTAINEPEQVPAIPRNYAPPPETSVITYIPCNAPDPLDEVRGSEGRRPWYVVQISKRPGIYASL